MENRRAGTVMQIDDVQIVFADIQAHYPVSEREIRANTGCAPEELAIIFPYLEKCGLIEQILPQGVQGKVYKPTVLGCDVQQRAVGVK